MTNKLGISDINLDAPLLVNWVEGSEFGTLELYFDEDGDLICVSNYSETFKTYKPSREFFLKVMSELYDKTVNIG